MKSRRKISSVNTSPFEGVIIQERLGLWCWRWQIKGRQKVVKTLCALLCPISWLKVITSRTGRDLQGVKNLIEMSGKGTRNQFLFVFYDNINQILEGQNVFGLE